jgi:hypothetical protein
MKILYLSCHAILEYDEISLLTELGHEVFSPGAYWNPADGGGGMRPPLPNISYRQEWVDIYNKICHDHPGLDGKDYLTRELVDHFDTVIVMHLPSWIQKNWDVMSHKPVIWRTIGQSVASTEQLISNYRQNGLKIVRYSPREVNIPHFAGQDAIIRFYKDPNVYKDWSGQNKRVITLAQSMQERDFACNYSVFERVTRPFNRALFGPGNDQPGLGFGKIPFEQLLSELSTNRVYFYTGTHPASYTLNFIEAFISGIPIVAVGPQYGNADYLRNHNLYEIPDLIQDGFNGFISNDDDVLESRIRQLMQSDHLATEISNAGRQTAIGLFGKDVIKSQWILFLERIKAWI